MTRYRIAAFLTSLALTFSLSSPVPPSCHRPTALYSERALRRMRNLFLIRTYEWKVRQLERARAAVQHRMTAGELLDPDVTSRNSIIAKGWKPTELKQSPSFGATACL
jgi:hypothetical protein